MSFHAAIESPSVLPQAVQDILFDPTIGRAILLVVGAALIWALRRTVSNSVAKRVRNQTTRYQTRKLIDFGGYLVFALFLGTVFSDKLGGLTVAFGVAGAGIAFALQEVVASVAGWLAITFGTFYAIGDRVMLGGIKGDVIDIGVLRTTIFQVGDWVNGDLYNGRVVRLANSFVFKEPVFNYSGDFPFLWDEITVPVRHGSDRDLTRKILQDAGDEFTGAYARNCQANWDDLTRKFVIEKARLEPMVTMTADENWMTFTLRYVVDFRSRRGTKDSLFERVLTQIDASEGAVSVASAAQEITLMNPPTQAAAGVDLGLPAS